MILNKQFIILIFFLAPAIACQEDNEPADVADVINVEAVTAFPNLSFTKPVDLQSAHDGSGRLFVVEQEGMVRSFINNPEVSETQLFLDIRDRVNDRGSEQGLLGLAFHPDFVNNGFFYVNYTAGSPDRTVISRFKINSGNAEEADENSEFVILTFNQPFTNHNGGQLAFGPDGYLYIATGDGGSGGDPLNNGQDRSTLHGNILRIDVNPGAGRLNYTIPADNPFVGNSSNFREEIYAYGFRNPWRMSFDPESGRLWTGDVGQNAFEEIDLVEKGGNYGWKIMEGGHCFPEEEPCQREGLILPVWDYAQQGNGRSVTGGYVYRGSNLTALQGLYVYGDFVSGRIWALAGDNPENAVNTLLADTDLAISSFGTDEKNELLICAFDGKIYRLINSQGDR